MIRFIVGVLPLFALTSAQAELVLEQSSAVPAQGAAPQVVIVQSQPVRSPETATAPQVEPAIVSTPAEVAPVEAVTQAPADDSSKLSRSELLRRQRMREELKNEDLLQTRLEELRLRNEAERTAPISQFGTPVPTPAPAPLAAPAPVVETVVAPTIVESTPVVPEIEPAASSQASPLTATVTSVDDFAPREKARVYLLPYGGMTKLVDTAGYDVQPRFSMGVALGVHATDHVAIEGSYTYAQHGIFIVSNNPFLRPGLVATPFGGPGSPIVDMTLKQNIFEIGPKVFLLRRDAIVRPFIGFSGVYSTSFLNYDQRARAALSQFGWGGVYGFNQNQNGVGQDYVLSQFGGSVSTGLDLQISESLSFGALFKYYRTLSSYENYPVNNAALYYGAFGQVPNYDPSVWDKNAVGGTLQNANAFSVQASLRLSF